MEFNENKMLWKKMRYWMLALLTLLWFNHFYMVYADSGYNWILDPIGLTLVIYILFKAMYRVTMQEWLWPKPRGVRDNNARQDTMKSKGAKRYGD